jgi:hypothetical protein
MWLDCMQSFLFVILKKLQVELEFKCIIEKELKGAQMENDISWFLD